MYSDTNKLLVWKRSHELALKVYEITKEFPKEEQFGLTSQIRRDAVSIPCNIVEGKARNSTRDYLRFLLISRGSLEEVKYQLLLSKDLKYISNDSFEITFMIADDVGKLLNGLIKSLEHKLN